MPRQPRIDIPGLLQHVIARGIDRNDIFLNDLDRDDFVERLDMLLDDTKTVCYAWALLDNHFHLLLMPTESSLAVLMRRLLTGYAVSFNLRHKRTGHLFQNRYKSIVCDSDTYLLELIRYINLNPVRAAAVKDFSSLVDYRWCGHRQMLGRGNDHLVVMDEVLSLFSRRQKMARKAYLQFLVDGLQQDAPTLSCGGRQVSQLLDSTLTDQYVYDDRFLGGGAFVERLLELEQVPEVLKTIDEIIELVADCYQINRDELRHSNKSRPIANAKAVICYLSIRRIRLPGIEVAKQLGYTPSAVSRAAIRGQKIIEEDETLQRRFK